MSKEKKIAKSIAYVTYIIGMQTSAFLAFHVGPERVNNEPSVWVFVFIMFFALYVVRRLAMKDNRKIGNTGFALMSAGLLVAIVSGNFVFSSGNCNEELRKMLYWLFGYGSVQFLFFDLQTYMMHVPTSKKKLDKDMFR